MSKRKDVLRVNDNVMIINPEIVLRCGYPLSKEDVKNTLITQEQKDSIRSMLKSFNITVPTSPFTIELGVTYDYDYVYDKVLNLMSYEILKQKNYGGTERTLHTEIKESLRNKVGYISKKKIVKTGTYHSSRGGGGIGYDGEFDYEPAYLKNEKARVLCLVRINPYAYDDVCKNINDNYDGGIWIENKNLQKIEKESE